MQLYWFGSEGRIRSGGSTRTRREQPVGGASEHGGSLPP